MRRDTLRKSSPLLGALLAVWGLASATDAAGDEPAKATKPVVVSMLGKEAGQWRDDNGLSLKLVWCPPGFVTMQQVDSFRRPKNVTPVKVFLTRGYWIGRYEVTQGEWKRLMGTAPWTGIQKIEDPDFPALNIDWKNAMAFGHRLTEQERAAGRLPEGWEYTLPSEAQWERACRARTETRFSFGDDESRLSDYAWFTGNRTRDIYRVGRKKPNPWGLYDMHGNAHEWCRDHFSESLPGGRDPEVTTGDSYRVIRGGSTGSDASDCESACRAAAVESSNGCGFRLALVSVGAVADAPASDEEVAAPYKPPEIVSGDKSESRRDVEQRALHTLTLRTDATFRESTLEDALKYFSDYHRLPIRIDEPSLDEAKISLESPVTLDANQIPFRRILDLILEPLVLDWHLQGSGLVVTTRAGAAAGSRRRLEAMLDHELEVADRVCGLSATQRETLRVAGTGDIRTLLAAIAERQTAYDLVKKDKEKGDALLGEGEALLEEIGWIKDRMDTGPFGNDSVFRKRFEPTLTAEQAVKYGPLRTILKAGGFVETIDRDRQKLLGAILIGATFTDAELARLERLTSLTIIRLDGTQVTDTGLVHLKSLPNLQVLGLSGTGITDAGLAHLRELSQLKQADLSYTKVTDAGLVDAKAWKNLRDLSLNGTAVTDAGVAHLRELLELRKVGFYDTKVTDAGLVHLEGLAKLEEIWMSQLTTDAGLKHLRGLTDLKTIHLYHSKVTDAGLVHFRGLKKLEELNLNATAVTDEGVAELTRALPDAEIRK